MQKSAPIPPTEWISTFLLKRSRPFEHAFFWLAVLFFYTLYFGARQDAYGQNLVFVGLLLPITIVTTYVVLYWLIPQYLLKRRYLLFSLYLVYTIVFSLYLELLLVLLLYINVSDYQTMFVSPGIVDLLDVLVGMYLVIFLASALNLLKRWYTIHTAHTELEKARIETELKLKSAELQLLKSQIHPHFLFNTLNNLYALALEKSDLVPDIVLRISEQLDYMLYRTNDKRVPLEDELHHIKNYIDLEALRFNEDQLQVSINLEGDLNDYMIEPLLLVPFIENSFKHGIGSSVSPGWIRLNLSVSSEAGLSFCLSNSKKATSGPDIAQIPTSSSSGIGLSNVRRRLELLYPNRHSLETTSNPESFSVKLTLHAHELS